MKSFGPLPRGRASDAVYEALRSAILSRVFQPGQRLKVHELAQQLDVSLTPVKDALSRLAAEELIAIRPRSGTFVTAMSPDDVAETFEIRAALECLAAETVVARATDAEIERLRELYDAIGLIAADDDGWTMHERRNGEFHNWIVRCSRNRKLISLYESLNAHIQIARIHRAEADWQQRLDVERGEHAAIVEAFEQRDPRAAVAALRQHISRAADSLVHDLRHQAADTTVKAATDESLT